MEAANVPDGGTGEYLTTLINHKHLSDKFSVCFAISQTMFEKPIHFCKCHYWILLRECSYLKDASIRNDLLVRYKATKWLTKGVELKTVP